MTNYVDDLLVKVGFEADELKTIGWRSYYYISIPV